MKKFLLMIIMVLGISVLAQAQTKQHKGHKTPEQKAQQFTAVLQKKLSLTADQSAKVNIILVKRATQMDSLKKATVTADNKKANKQARKAILLSADKDLKAVFTASQTQTYEQLKAQLKEKHKNKKDVMAPAEGK